MPVAVHFQTLSKQPSARNCRRDYNGGSIKNLSSHLQVNGIPDRSVKVDDTGVRVIVAAYTSYRQFTPYPEANKTQTV